MMIIKKIIWAILKKVLVEDQKTIGSPIFSSKLKAIFTCIK
jgi:hypothetical protein